MNEVWLTHGGGRGRWLHCRVAGDKTRPEESVRDMPESGGSIVPSHGLGADPEIGECYHTEV